MRWYRNLNDGIATYDLFIGFSFSVPLKHLTCTHTLFFSYGYSKYCQLIAFSFFRISLSLSFMHKTVQTWNISTVMWLVKWKVIFFFPFLLYRRMNLSEIAVNHGVDIYFCIRISMMKKPTNTRKCEATIHLLFPEPASLNHLHLI